MTIHQTALIEPGAELAADVSVGAYSVIGPKVKLGPGVVVGEHVIISGRATLGECCRAYPGAIIGSDPQDLKFAGEDTAVQIGPRTVVREFVTINKGTGGGGGCTSIGADCMVMAYCHVAHDCIVENNVIMANCSTLAGHVLIERGVHLSGMVGIHHFGTVGRLAFISGWSTCRRDAPPFMILDGNPARVRGVNIVGLQRAGASRETIGALRQCCRLLYHSALNQDAAIERIRADGLDQHEEVKYLLDFLKRVEGGNLGRAREALRKQHGAHPPAPAGNEGG